MTTTIIRHRVLKETIAIVVTSFGRNFEARFQVYRLLPNGDSGSLITSQPSDGEQWAIEQYNNYIESLGQLTNENYFKKLNHSTVEVLTPDELYQEEQLNKGQ